MDNTQKVLKLISTSPDYVSGEAIATKLQLSRTAIWKIVKHLQEDGFPISSKRHAGYYYTDTGKLNTFIIQQHLKKELRTQLSFEVHEKISSTSTRAKELAVHGSQTSPTVILANQQLNGYGRYGRNFDSPGTGIYLSILLKNPSTSLNPGLLTTATALALTLAIEKKLAVFPKIKWVNDIVLNDKKVIGILTEAVADIESQTISQLVVGIGVNYLTDPTSFPIELQKRAGSFRQAVLAQKVSRNIFIANILNEFFTLYAHYEDGAFLDEYRKRSLMLGKEVTLVQGNRKFSGIVKTIDDQGRLVLHDGTRFSSGEVTKTRLVTEKKR